MTSEEQARADLTRIYRAALEAVAPDRLTAAALRGELDGARDVPAIVAQARRVFVVAAGKAAARMMAAAMQHLAGRISDAVAVVPAADLRFARAAAPGARLYPGGHPLPDDNSATAAQAVLDACGPYAARPAAGGAQRRSVGDGRRAGTAGYPGRQDCGHCGIAARTGVNRRGQRRAQAPVRDQGRTPAAPLQRRPRAEPDSVR